MNGSLDAIGFGGEGERKERGDIRGPDVGNEMNRDGWPKEKGNRTKK